MSAFIRELKELEKFYIRLDDYLTDAESKLQEVNPKLVVVVDSEHNFMGIITPTDIESNIKLSATTDKNQLRVVDFYNKTPVTITTEELDNHRANNSNPFNNVKHKYLIVIKDKRAHSIIYPNPNPKCPAMPITRKPFVNVDILNTCNLRCVCCPRGTREIRNTSDKMSLELFESIIQKACIYNVGCRINIYNWCEPFLCDDLEKYTEIADNYGLPTHISSNMSMPNIKSLKKVLYTGKGAIIVSVSGFTQEIHQIYHRGSNISVVKDHLLFISDCYKSKPFERHVAIRFLDFGYNAHEMDMFKTWILDLPGLCFTSITGGGTPLKTPPADYQDDIEFHRDEKVTARYLSQFPKKPGEWENTYPSINRVCEMFNDLIIDYKGDSFLCCSKPNYPLFKLGNILEDEIDDILLRRLFHPFCQICAFGQKLYEVPESLKRKITTMLNE